MNERSRTWSKQGVTVTATIKDDGKHEVTIAGTITMPLRFTGDAYNSEGEPVAIPRVHGIYLIREMIDNARWWVCRYAPQPPVPRRLQE